MPETPREALGYSLGVISALYRWEKCQCLLKSVCECIRGSALLIEYLSPIPGESGYLPDSNVSL